MIGMVQINPGPFECQVSIGVHVIPGKCRATDKQRDQHQYQRVSFHHILLSSNNEIGWSPIGTKAEQLGRLLTLFTLGCQEIFSKNVIRMTFMVRECERESFARQSNGTALGIAFSRYDFDQRGCGISLALSLALYLPFEARTPFVVRP